MTDFHNTSLDQKDYLEIQSDKAEALAIANLNTTNCWSHNGFMDFYRAVCDSATKQAETPYGGFDYDGAFDEGTPLEIIIEALQDGDTADETAEALLQGEAEQAYEDSISGEPPITLAEMHHAAWVRKQELNS